MKKLLKRTVAFTLTSCLLLFALSCGAPQGAEDHTHADTIPAAGTSEDRPIHTDTPTEAPTDPTTEAPNLVLAPGKTDLTDDLKPTRNALMDYYLAMFKDLVKDGSENAVMSPYSIFVATAMATEGAKGQTLAELEALMGVSQADLAKIYGLYLGEYGKASSLVTANSLWVDTHEGLTVNQATFDRLQTAYGAGVFHQDLQAPETLEQLNGWISDHTKGRIPKMLDEIGETSRLMLVNALSFDAEWAEAYTEHQQREGEFTNADGSTVTATMLSSVEYYYLEDANARGFYKCYKQGEDGKCYAFAAILPREGMTPAEYLSTLDGDGLRKMLFNYSTDVTLTTKLPAFKTDAAYELSETYQKLGCVTPFSGSADFTGLAVSNAPLCIGSITHKAAIEVDALGTKAGAATVIDMTEGAVEPGIFKEVILDRPFIYMIVDCDTGLPVFMGITAEIG